MSVRSGAKIHRGVVTNITHLQPFIGPQMPSPEGVNLGVNLYTNSPFNFDPWGSQVAGRVNSTVYAVLGGKNSGKSTLLKALAVRLGSMRAGAENGDPNPRIRVLIHDRKPEDGEPEFAPVIRFLGGEPYKLNRPGLVNLFDTSILIRSADEFEYNLLYMALAIAVDVNQKPLSRYQTLAIQVALNKMIRGNGLINPQMLATELRHLDVNDLSEYFAGLNNQLKKTIEDDIATDSDVRERWVSSFEVVISKPHNVDPGQFLDDSGKAADLFGRLAGEYGGVFTGQESLRSILTQDAVLLDWTGLNANASRLLGGFLMYYRQVALNTHDLKLTPHVEIMDEDYEAVKNLIWLRAQNEISKKARALHTAIFRSTQSVHDYLDAGNQGSETRGLAESLVRNTGGWFIGHQPADQKTLDFLRSSLRISDENVEKFPNLPTRRGFFAYVTQNTAPVFFCNLLTPIELGLVQTNSASKRTTTRTAIQPPVDYLRRGSE